MDYNSFLKFVKNRRSIREIKPDPVPDEYIEKILEAARWAPSGFNMQPWEFVVVRDPDLKKGIKQIVDDYRTNDFFPMEATREEWQGSPWTPDADAGEFRLAEAPVYIVLFGDTRTNVGLPMPARHTYQKMWSIYDSTMANAFLYMLLAAEALGLAAHYTSATKIPKVACLIKDLLNIPNELEIYDMMLVGYSDYKPGPKMMRNKKTMIHYDKAGPNEFRSEEDVRKTIIKFREGNVGRHKDADTARGKREEETP